MPPSIQNLLHRHRAMMGPLISHPGIRDMHSLRETVGRGARNGVKTAMNMVAETQKSIARAARAFSKAETMIRAMGVAYRNASQSNMRRNNRRNTKPLQVQYKIGWTQNRNGRFQQVPIATIVTPKNKNKSKKQNNPPRLSLRNRNEENGEWLNTWKEHYERKEAKAKGLPYRRPGW
jgi:hypothetical protein